MNADDAAIAVVLCAFTDEDDFEEENERGVRLLSRRKSGVVAF